MRIVDDGSSDGSVKALKAELHDPRICHFHQENAGKSVALNRALASARGDLFCIMDADDIAYPDRLSRLVSEMERFPHLGGVLSGYELILNGQRVAPLSVGKNEVTCQAEIASFRLPSHDPTLMVRTELARRMLFSEDLRVGQGIDFILRLGERHPMRVVPEVLYAYRIHSQSITRNNVEHRRKLIAEVFRRAAERRGVETPGQNTRPYRATRFRNRDLDNQLPAHFKASVRELKRAGRFTAAVSTALCCAKRHPFDPDYYHPLLMCLLPVSFLQRMKANVTRR